MRILVCGGRDFTDYNLLERTLNDYDTPTIIHGAARGADSLAERYARSKALVSVSFPALWDLHGKSAGPIRNIQMLEEGQPDLVIAFPGGKGTQHMINIAKKAKIEVIEIAI